MVPTSVRLIITPHAQIRMKERVTEDFALPLPNTYIRLLTARDTRYNKDMRLLLVHGGVIICKKVKNNLIVLTVFSNKRFSRFQQRLQSRFIPVASECYLLHQVEIVGGTKIAT